MNKTHSDGDFSYDCGILLNNYSKNGHFCLKNYLEKDIDKIIRIIIK